MKKYTKPSVKVVNLKSSNDIATTFSELRGKFRKDYLMSGATESSKYAVSVYANTTSAMDAENALEG